MTAAIAEEDRKVRLASVIFRRGTAMVALIGIMAVACGGCSATGEPQDAEKWVRCGSSIVLGAALQVAPFSAADWGINAMCAL